MIVTTVKEPEIAGERNITIYQWRQAEALLQMAYRAYNASVYSGRKATTSMRGYYEFRETVDAFSRVCENLAEVSAKLAKKGRKKNG